MTPYLLTICIATYNRAAYLPDTLNSIVGQIDAFDDVEVLVVDGNSTDGTESVVNRFQLKCRNLHYLKLEEKGGVDKDFDIAVNRSSGLYCWLFTDDDLLRDDAVSKVRDAIILKGAGLIVVNSEICDHNIQRVLKKNALSIECDVETDLSSAGRERLFKLCATYMTFIGSIVIKRVCWVESPRDMFYGTRFIHVGVISTLSDKTKVLVLAEPVIRIRLGNAEWNNLSFKVWTQLWPNLIWSLSNLSPDCKKAICLFEPWKRLSFLLWERALGAYSRHEYSAFLSLKPISIYKAMAFLCAYLPRRIPRLIFYIYATFRRDELILYILGDGSKSKNAWLSEA